MFPENRTRAHVLTLVLVLLLALLFLLHFSVPLAASPDIQDEPLDKVEPLLLDRLVADGTADFIVRFTEQADLSPAYSMDWEKRGEFVVRALTETAQRSQERAKAFLDGRGLRHQTFIAGNELYVWAGDLQVVQALAAFPEVDFIRATRTYYIDPIAPLDSSSEPAPQSLNWDVADTGADDFWTQFGVQGDGIVVANIDTGVQWDHPALDQAYKYPANPTDPSCWYDPSNICGGSVCDNMGHGTHTMGTMVGDDDPSLPYQVGMAPNAQWIACKGCGSISCSEFALNACADWILAPGGSPNNRPHVVNNSWGGGCDNWYLAKVQAWRAAGIFPAFSAGNSGPSCNTLGSPGDYQESFGSAAHDSSRNIASFSSRGPSCFGHDPYTKPNISAPGVNICSSVPTNSWNCTYSGTSMSSPHSAGAVALLWSCNPALIGQMDLTFQALQNNADTPPAGNCGAPPDNEGNYTYGYLNVYAADQAACGILQAPTLYDPGDYSTSGNYTVDWTDVTGANSYLLQEDDNSSFSSPAEYTTPSSQYSFTGKADGYYYYRAAAKKGSQTSAWSNTVDIIVDKTPPSNPSSVWSTSHSPYTWSNDNTVDMAWSGAWDGEGSGMAGYSIEWSTSWDALPDTIIDITGTTATSPALSDGNSWYFHIRTADNAGNWNAEAVHRGPYYIDATAPNSSVEPLPAQSPTSFLVRWSGIDPSPASGLTTYDVQYRIGPSGVWTDWLSATTLTSATFGPVQPVQPQPGQTYYFRCRARDQIGNLPIRAAMETPGRPSKAGPSTASTCPWCSGIVELPGVRNTRGERDGFGNSQMTG